MESRAFKQEQFDYLIVGSGFSGATFAREALDRGKRCLVIEKRQHVAGNAHCDMIHGIQVHRYGAHIFHTSNERVWQYVNRYARFRNFINQPVANYKGAIYNLPFNMNTFAKMWSISSPAEAQRIIETQRGQVQTTPKNLEEQAIQLVGRDIYETLIKGYTEKQWGRECAELPPDIIKRIPVRFTYNNNYFNDIHQGIPEAGYDALIEALLDGAQVCLKTDYLSDKAYWDGMADRVVYTGMIDAYFQYQFGHLEYRSLRFSDEALETDNYQGVAVMNFTDGETPFTRIIEHKHFGVGGQDGTIITREYPETWTPDKEPFYPVNNIENQQLYQQYVELAQKEQRVVFLGRLAQYSYCDMDRAVLTALNAANAELGHEYGGKS